MTDKPFTVKFEKITRDVYRLKSAAFLFAPGFLEWVKILNKTDPVRALQLFCQAYENFPEDLAYDLLSGRLPFTVEGEDVVITHEY